MNRHEALRLLTRHKTEICGRFGVRDLAIFGSVARNQARPESDVDVLVSFQGRADFDRFMDLKFYLEELLGVSVDLVTENALRPQLRPAINREAIHVP